MNVSANSYNRNANDYVELACLLLLSTAWLSLPFGTELVMPYPGLSEEYKDKGRPIG